MRKFVIILMTTCISLIMSCTSGKYLEMTKSGDEYFRQGSYTEALETSEQIITEIEAKGKIAPGNVYMLAGMAAYETQDYNKSIKYLEKARQNEYSDDNLYLYLAKNFKHIDNLSKEITALENYLLKYPSGKETVQVRGRLLETCIESENFSLADRLWTEMDSTSRTEIGNLETWLILNRMQENGSVCDSVATVILQSDPVNEPALKWTAESHFWRAEDSYQYHMKAYKENRTRKQYSILLQAFKQVNADFIASRDYFLKLYEMNPDPEYARYLGNIFTRLDDDRKASYYKNLSN